MSLLRSGFPGFDPATSELRPWSLRFADPLVERRFQETYIRDNLGFIRFAHVFSSFDDLADRHGLEKIKTIGDAYMAVAGTSAGQDDPVAAADMALEILTWLERSTWPGGEPIGVWIGLACGPAVAGVIGRQRFAYDLWGDTVNLASRLEATGEPGKVLVADTTYEALRDRYVFSDPIVLQLKGKGPTSARFLLGRQQPGVTG